MVVSVRRDSSGRPERRALMSRRFLVPRGMRRGAFTAVAAVLLTSAAACSADNPASVATQDGTGDTAVAQDTGEPSGTAPDTVDARNDAADSASATVSTGVGLADGIGGSDPWQNTTASPAPGPIASNGTAGSLDDVVPAGDPFVTAPTEEAAEFLVDALRASSFRPVQGRSFYMVAYEGTQEMEFVVDADGDSWTRLNSSDGLAYWFGEESLLFETIEGSDGLAYTRYLGDNSELSEMYGDQWNVSDVDSSAHVELVCINSLLGDGQADHCVEVNDHSELISYIKAAEIVGAAVIDGVDTTHVRFTVNDGSEPDADAGEPDIILPDLDFPMNAWIGDDGLIRRIAMDTDALVSAVIAIVVAEADMDLDGFSDPEDREVAERFLTARIEFLRETVRIEQTVTFDVYDTVDDVPNPPDGPTKPAPASIFDYAVDDITS